MSTAIQILKNEFELPIDVATEHGHETSVIRVMQQVSDLQLTDDQYIIEILRLTNIGREAIDEPALRAMKHLPKYVFGYTIQMIIKAYVNNNAPIDLPDVFVAAYDKARTYITAHPWVFATGEDENAPPKLDSNGNIQPKKGDKKIMAKKVYEDNKSKNLARKEWIALLVKEVGLTEAGASTYYANLKKGTY